MCVCMYVCMYVCVGRQAGIFSMSACEQMSRVAVITFKQYIPKEIRFWINDMLK